MQARAEIVPIRFDVEVDGKFLKDAFCWNAKESQEAVEEFVVGLIKDARLPQSFVAVMVDSMQRQINEFRMVEEKAKARALQETERLEVIKITLRCGTTSIQDSFVWDIFSKSEDDPELFARTLCRDLELDERELAPLIAHKIREEVFNKKKELFALIQTPKSVGKGKKKAGLPAGRFAPQSPFKLGPVGVGGGIRHQSDQHSFETVVTHLTSEEAVLLDEEDEKRAVEVRQEAVAKKIHEIQEKSRKGKKLERDRMMMKQQMNIGALPNTGWAWGSWGNKNWVGVGGQSMHQMQTMYMDHHQAPQQHAQVTGPLPGQPVFPPHAQGSHLPQRATTTHGHFVHPHQAAMAGQVHLTGPRVHHQYQQMPHPQMHFHNQVALHQHQQGFGSSPVMYPHPAHQQPYHPHQQVGTPIYSHPQQQRIAYGGTPHPLPHQQVGPSVHPSLPLSLFY